MTITTNIAWRQSQARIIFCLFLILNQLEPFGRGDMMCVHYLLSGSDSLGNHQALCTMYLHSWRPLETPFGLSRIIIAINGIVSYSCAIFAWQQLKAVQVPTPAIRVLQRSASIQWVCSRSRTWSLAAVCLGIQVRLPKRA
jgi:hypothetical protein